MCNHKLTALIRSGGTNKQARNVSQKPSQAYLNATDNVDPLTSLRAKLKTADPEMQNYVTALENEKLKCARQVAKLQAENVSLNNRIKVPEEEYPKKQEVVINVVHDKPLKKD